MAAKAARRTEVFWDNESGHVAVKKKIDKGGKTAFIGNLPPCVIGMEPCGRAHHRHRIFTGMGHTVHPVAPKFVKPFISPIRTTQPMPRRSAKRYNAPRCASSRPRASSNGRAEHPSDRSPLIADTAAQGNQIKGWLLEYEITIPQGLNRLRKRAREIIEDAQNTLTPMFRGILSELYDEIVHLEERIASLEKKLESVGKQSGDRQLLRTIPGMGLLTATALVAAIGNPSAFKSAREVAARLVPVPRQHSTGGKPTLLGISERGDSYLRSLLIYGGRAVVQGAGEHNRSVA